jgi:phosphohistidine swiveling domain-containing protein
MPIDRSISALRTLRPDRDAGIFWFRDDLHQPYPISPMGMTTIQKHHAWGYHVASEQTQLPPSKGAHVKIHGGRVYLGFALIDDPDEVAGRAKTFGELVDHVTDHWAEFYGGYISEVVANLASLGAVDADRLTTPHLLDYLRKTEEINRRHWEIHFILMYPADTIYLQFEAFCKEHGVDEKDFVNLLKGFNSMSTKTDEGLWALAEQADAAGLRERLQSTSADALREVLESEPAGRAWLDTFDAWLARFGNRISAGHLDVMYPTWKEDPAPVLDTINSYFGRMDAGWNLLQARDEVMRQRDEVIAAVRERLNAEDTLVFERLLPVAQEVYAFQEDHGFYIDAGSTAVVHNTLMACGRRLRQLDLVEQVEDVFFLTFSELVEILDDLARNEKIGTYHHQALVPSLVAERKDDWSRAATVEAPLTVGNVPTTMNDPIALKVFGIVDEVLHPKGEKQVVEHLEGFAGSAGVVEGPARVVLSFEEFPTLQSGEILVCPATSTAWTPLFLKIAGVVTDTGGMLTHAAIAAREYGIPAVVGTWNATNSIHDGDVIRVDGTAGVVEVLARATGGR